MGVENTVGVFEGRDDGEDCSIFFLLIDLKTTFGELKFISILYYTKNYKFNFLVRSSFLFSSVYSKL